MSIAYAKLMDRVRDVSRLRAVQELLGWDQETYMPVNGVPARAEQLALIAGLAHQHLVADETRSLLDEASADPDDYVTQANLRETRRTIAFHPTLDLIFDRPLIRHIKPAAVQFFTGQKIQVFSLTARILFFNTFNNAPAHDDIFWWCSFLSRNLGSLLGMTNFGFAC